MDIGVLYAVSVSLMMTHSLLLSITLEQRPYFSIVNREGCNSCTPLYLRNGLEFFMRFSPTGRGVQAHFFWCLRCRKIISHAHTNSKQGSHDTNEMLANFQGKPPFLRSRNTVGLMQTLSYVWVSNRSKMAACNRKWIWNNIFQLVYMIAKKFQRSYPRFRGQETRRD